MFNKQKIFYVRNKRIRQFSIYHFIAYEMLILNIHIFYMGLEYLPGDILDSVWLDLDKKLDLTE